MAIELLEELLFGKFGFHILEPIAKYENKVKVRPIVKKIKAKQSQYMSGIEKNVRQEEI